MTESCRYVALDDISVRTEGNDRIIDVYAAVFGTRSEIRDFEGHYFEELHPNSFDRTIAQRAGKFQVLFNHGMTIHGTPSERFSMPYGTALSVRADSRGVLTSTKVANTPLGDEVLELVDSGAIRGQSFGAKFLQSDRTKRHEGIPLFVRTEAALREYGLTPFPSYHEAAVVGRRAELAELPTEDLVELLLGRPESDRADVLGALTAAAGPGTSTLEAPGPPDARVITRSDLQRQLRELDLETLR